LQTDDDATLETEQPSPAPTEYPTETIFQLRDDDDNTLSPTPKPTLVPTRKPTIDETGLATGVAVTYNITIDSRSLGFSTPQEAFDALTAELITAIDSGNFTHFLHEEAKLMNVPFLVSASTTITDFAIKNFLLQSPPSRARATQAPTGTPTSEPSGMPTGIPLKSRGPFEIVAGIVIISIIFALMYLTSVLIGCLRVASEKEHKHFDKEHLHLKYGLAEDKSEFISDDKSDHLPINLDALKLTEKDLSV